MKIRIIAAMLAAAMLLGGAALAAEDLPAPSPASDVTAIPTETITPTEGEAATETRTPTADLPSIAVAYGENNEWFDEELAEANSLGLIPARFAGADLRVPMSRAEFAAVALLVYERMSGKSVPIPGSNPFEDTTDADVLRAHSAGIVNGVSADTFSPHAQVSRQQTATMLTRVYKAVNWAGWTLANDATYSSRTLDYGGVVLYADDGMIDDYAFAPVYFLTKYGVTKGVGNDCFDPDAGCTREEGIVLALRLYKVFGL